MLYPIRKIKILRSSTSIKQNGVCFERANLESWSKKKYNYSTQNKDQKENDADK